VEGTPTFLVPEDNGDAMRANPFPRGRFTGSQVLLDGSRVPADLLGSLGQLVVSPRHDFYNLAGCEIIFGRVTALNISERLADRGQQ
jgi:hypothetical protein